MFSNDQVATTGRKRVHSSNDWINQTSYIRDRIRRRKSTGYSLHSESSNNTASIDQKCAYSKNDQFIHHSQLGTHQEDDNKENNVAEKTDATKSLGKQVKRRNIQAYVLPLRDSRKQLFVATEQKRYEVGKKSNRTNQHPKRDQPSKSNIYKFPGNLVQDMRLGNQITDPKSVYAFLVPQGRAQYLGLVEGTVLRSKNGFRENYLNNFRYELSNKKLNPFPSNGMATELLPTELAPGEWRMKVVQNDITSIDTNSMNCSRVIMNSFKQKQRQWNNKIISLYHSNSGEKYSTTANSTDNGQDDAIAKNETYHTIFIDPSQRREDVIRRQEKEYLSNSSEEPHTAGSSSKNVFVGCLSLVAFDGFDTASESQVLEAAFVDVILDATKTSLIEKSKERSRMNHFGQQDNVEDNEVSPFLCTIPPFDIASSLKRSSMPMEQCNSVTGVGGISAVVDVDISHEKESNTYEGDSFILQITTCEESRNIVAVRGKFGWSVL